MPVDTPSLSITGSRLFPQWLDEMRVSLVFNTYQSGKIFFVGLDAQKKLAISERTFDRPMGLAARDQRIWMSTRAQMWRFENFIDPGTNHDGFDARFVPVAGHTTGDVDIHDVQIRPDGSPVFAVTRFNAIAALGERGSFKVLWTPPFIDKIAAEDRCHLNGLALDGHTLKYATMVGHSNISDGWRDHRHTGGLVMDIPSNEVVCDGLSMPHSPRLYQDKLWVLQSGTGEFGTIDIDTGAFNPVCFVPGFARGLSFAGDYAIIGVSLPRDNRSFTDLPFVETLAQKGGRAKCGLCVVNLQTGDLEHQLLIEGVVQELYDVCTLPGIITPTVVGWKSDEINFVLKPELEGDLSLHRQ